MSEENKTEFEIGQEVVLNSGGPTMTVRWIGTRPYGQYQMIDCVWYNGVEFKNEMFRAEMIKKSK